MTKKLSDYEIEGFEGNDASIEISLFEYGLIWKQTNNQTIEYRFVFGVETDNSGNYTKFDYGYMNQKDFNSLICEDWFKLSEVLDFCGQSQLNFPNDIQICLQYHGAENIFGSSSDSFTIENPDNE